MKQCHTSAHSTAHNKSTRTAGSLKEIHTAEQTTKHSIEIESEAMSHFST